MYLECGPLYSAGHTAGTGAVAGAVEGHGHRLRDLHLRHRAGGGLLRPRGHHLRLGPRQQGQQAEPHRRPEISVRKALLAMPCLR